MKRRIYLFIKHLFDRVIAIIMLLILLIPMILLSMVLTCYYRGNPFYVAKRAGLKGKVFSQYKFKSMRDIAYDVDASDKTRITPVGKWLREWSIDELPQLINVIKGDVSLVGPRPLTPEYLPLYTDKTKRRLNVKPGLTGLAQVNGRNELSWDKKFMFDVYYVDHFSIFMDIKILFQTVVVVLLRKGINQNEFITAERYEGSE